MIDDEIKVVKSNNRSKEDYRFLDKTNLSLSAIGMLATIRRHQREWMIEQLDFIPRTSEEIEAINELVREGYIHVDRSH